MKTYIIAGSTTQFERWSKRLRLNNPDTEYVYIPDGEAAQILSGTISPHILKVGTWYERRDHHSINKIIKNKMFTDPPAIITE